MSDVNGPMHTPKTLPGIPVATVAIDGSKNAAFMAARLLAGTHPELRERLQAQLDASKGRYDSPDMSTPSQADKRG